MLFYIIKKGSMLSWKALDYVNCVCAKINSPKLFRKSYLDVSHAEDGVIIIFDFCVGYFTV